jgi:chromosome segregation ATPase
MQEEKTAEIKDPRSFEERVFARFDAVDNRFDLVDERFERIEGRLSNVEIRIIKLEERQYDTKPIWERALAAIAETSQQLTKAVTEINSRLDTIDNRFNAIDNRFDAIDARFNKQEFESEHNFRKVRRRLEALNDTLLELRADQRYVDRRLEKIEEQNEALNDQGH